MASGPCKCQSACFRMCCIISLAAGITQSGVCGKRTEAPHVAFRRPDPAWSRGRLPFCFCLDWEVLLQKLIALREPYQSCHRHFVKISTGQNVHSRRRPFCCGVRFPSAYLSTRARLLFSFYLCRRGHGLIINVNGQLEVCDSLWVRSYGFWQRFVLWRLLACRAVTPKHYEQ